MPRHHQDADGRAVPAHDAGGEGRRRRGPVDDAGAVSVVPADPADGEARLARAADLRGEPRVPAHRGRRRPAAHQLQRGGPDAAGAFLAGLLAGPYAGAIVGVDGRDPGADRRRMDRAALRDRLRLRRRRPPRDLSQGSDLALLAAVLHRPAPQRVAPRAPVPDRLGRDPAGGADRARNHPPGARPRFGAGRIFYLAPHEDLAAAPRRRWPRSCASRSRSRSGTARASSTGCRSRRSC